MGPGICAILIIAWFGWSYLGWTAFGLFKFKIPDMAFVARKILLWKLLVQHLCSLFHSSFPGETAHGPGIFPVCNNFDLSFRLVLPLFRNAGKPLVEKTIGVKEGPQFALSFFTERNAPQELQVTPSPTGRKIYFCLGDFPLLNPEIFQDGFV